MDAKTREQLTDYLAAADALLLSMNTSVAGDGQNIWKYAGFHTYARKYSHLVQAIAKLVTIETVVDRYDIEKMPSSHDTTIVRKGVNQGNRSGLHPSKTGPRDRGEAVEDKDQEQGNR